MFAALAALALAATPSEPAAALQSTAAWWEKITITLSGDGKAQSCQYRSSVSQDAPSNCEVSGGGQARLKGASLSPSSQEYTRITFERRFSPGEIQPHDGAVQAGDKLLGRSVMQLAIDSSGKVRGCKVVLSSGDVQPDYGCDDASIERFQPAAQDASAVLRAGFMTVLIYGHSEHIA